MVVSCDDSGRCGCDRLPRHCALAAFALLLLCQADCLTQTLDIFSGQLAHFLLIKYLIEVGFKVRGKFPLLLRWKLLSTLLHSFFMHIVRVLKLV